MLTVVVPTRNRCVHLVGCLGVLRPVLGPDDQILVVDSSEQPPPADVATDSGAVVLHAPGTGVSWARNAGVALARYEFVAFVDDDVHVADGWRDAIVGALHRTGAPFVTGRIDVPADQVTRQRKLTLKMEATGAVIDDRYPSPVGHSANMAVRKAAFTAIGGFDERMGPGGRWRAAEDLDLFDRFLTAGYRGWYEPSARAYHDQWRTRRQLIRVDWTYGIGSGARLARLTRANPRRAARAARECLWTDGALVLARAVASWQEFLIATTATRLGATLVTFPRAALSSGR